MAQAEQTHSTFDPTRDTHFGVSEQDEFKLRQIAIAMEAIGDMMEAVSLQQEIEVPEDAVGSVFRAMSYGIRNIIDSGTVVFPHSVN